MAVDKAMMGRRTFVKGGLAASALAALAGASLPGCAKSGSGSEKTLSWYLNNPECIDPYNTQEDQGTQVEYQLFDALTDYDFKNSKLIANAASSWESNADATQFTFHLVSGAKFHNGEDVNSKAFKRGWERIVNPATHGSPSVISYHLALVKGYDELQAGTGTELTGCTCPDDSTFVVELTAPYADFPYVCAHPALAPVPQAALDNDASFYTAPIGNGAFKMKDGTKWEDGQYIDLVRFDGYYGDKAKIAAIHFNIQKDNETAYREFQAGNIDVADVPTSQIKDAISSYGQSDDGYTISSGKGVSLGAQPSTYYICCNTQDQYTDANGNKVDNPMKNVNLRRAISLAINRQAICDSLFDGTRSPADNIVPPSIDGYEAGAWEYSKYDKDAAVAMLDKYYPADASGSRGLNLTLSYNLDGSHKQIMESVISDLSAVGINVTSATGEWATILQDYDNGKFMMGRLGWIADYPIMDNFLYPLFYTGNGDNRSQYSNTAVDAGIKDARSTTDDAQRISKMQAVNKIIGTDCPVIPLMFYKLTKVAGKNVKSLYVNADGKCNMKNGELN